ncbi:hypothetical protein YC2023_045066 [Brassica napus]
MGYRHYFEAFERQVYTRALFILSQNTSPFYVRVGVATVNGSNAGALTTSVPTRNLSYKTE